MSGATRRLASEFGLAPALRQGDAWRACERRARARGEPARDAYAHAARHVCQGLIETEDALASLVLIEMQAAEREGFIPRGAEGLELTSAETVALRRRFAAHLLELAIAREEDTRSLLAARMARAIEPMLARRASTADMVRVLLGLNFQAGRVFVWPELRELLAEQVGRHMRGMARQRRSLAYV